MPTTANRRLPWGTASLVAGLMVCGLAFRGLAADESAESRTFKLREVSVFNADLNKDQNSFLRGQMCRCQDTPFPEVKHYPAFVSKVPVFGSVQFGRRPDDTNSGARYYFAVDESRGTGKGYDCFYFDANRDLDLRNDPVGKVQQPAPDHGYQPNFSGIKSVTAFDFLKLNLGTNGSDGAPIEIMRIRRGFRHADCSESRNWRARS